jgi:hypothetical protein
MSDIVEWLCGDWDWPDGTDAAHKVAADEIERLRALALAFVNCQTEENENALRRALGEKT